MRAFIGSLSKPFYLVGTVSILLAWELVAVRTLRILPGLREVGLGLLLLAETGELWRQLGISLHRSLTGLFVGAALGFFIGAAAGFSAPIYYLLKPLIGALLSAPAVVVVMLSMVWFGIGSFMAVFVTAMFTVPIMYVSVVEGMAMVDRDLLEMASVYRISRWSVWWNIYLPALATAILTGLAFAAGTAFRKTVMAELLGSNDGIGFAMAMTRFSLDASRFFAWVTVCLAVAIAIEIAFVRPVAHCLNRWRKPGSAAGVAYE